MSSSVCIVIPAGAGLTPKSRAMAFAELCSTHTSGYVIRPSQSRGTASPTRQPLGALERDRLRHELAEDDAEVGQDQEREQEGDAARDPVVEVARDERLPEGTEEDPEDGDPDLDRAR